MNVGGTLAGVAQTAPDWARHALAVFLSAGSSVILQAVVKADGVTGVDWPHTLAKALDQGAYAAAAGLVLLSTTPLTRRYGLFAQPDGAGPPGQPGQPDQPRLRPPHAPEHRA